MTQFTDGTGPVWQGSLFPFLFITIACGAMLRESFVAIMAMVAASIIDPGVYFAMNSPPALIGTDATTVAQTVSSWGFVVTSDVLTATAADIGESSIRSRAGGVPTMAVGIAQILHSVPPGASCCRTCSAPSRRRCAAPSRGAPT